ncbi:MAG: adenosylcobinamide-GDP ribazoletransferase [Lachnospiraceae bacterium]|nr:adenosylcobinamide-GDP ribazoletransferase [Lachnospiraceae bacterium]
MKDILQGFVVAFSMYSKIPMPRITWTKKNMKYCMCFFPLIGLVIGGLMYGWFRLALWADFGVLFRTAVLILIPVAVTGGIHLDGFLDTADALSSYKSQEEKLEILKDSHAGAFAIIMGISYFVLAFGVYSEMTEEKLKVLALGFMLSRAFSGLGLVSLKKAKNSGLLYTFADAAANRRVGIVMGGYILAAVGGMLWIDRICGGVAAVLAFASFLWYRHMSYSKFGGITGDLAGCFVQTAELVMALGIILV